MRDKKSVTTTAARAKLLRRPATFGDKLGMFFIGVLLLVGIVVFSTLFVPDFMRRIMQANLAEGGGALAAARIVSVVETGRWYAKQPILHFSVQVTPAGSTGFNAQFEQEVGMLQLAQLRVGAHIWVRYAPDDLSDVVIVNAPVNTLIDTPIGGAP